MMILGDYADILKALLDKLPAASWLLPILTLLLIIKMVMPKFTWSLKLEADNYGRSTKQRNGRKER
jgi:hypothetical protein